MIHMFYCTRAHLFVRCMIIDYVFEIIFYVPLQGGTLSICYCCRWAHV
jgi:hypothetical protein